MLTIGVDVGGTKIAAGVVDEAGAIVARRRIETQAADPQAVVAGIAKVVQELRAAAPAASAVGIGAAGLVDAARGVVLSAPNIAWSDVHLRALIEDRAGLPAVVDNDANAAALGEALHGAGRDAGDQIMITVGTGIGGGFVFGGSLYRGGGGLGAEVGHMIVAAGGEVCGCGNRGCWETVASGTALGRMARARAAEEAARGVVERAGSIPAITGVVVGEAAAAGDPFAVGLVEEAGRWLGLGMGNLVNLLDPALIVASGGVVDGVGDLLLEPARAALEAHALGGAIRRLPPVVRSALGPDAGVVGAAAMARTAG